MPLRLLHHIEFIILVATTMLLMIANFSRACHFAFIVFFSGINLIIIVPGVYECIQMQQKKANCFAYFFIYVKINNYKMIQRLKITKTQVWKRHLNQEKEQSILPNLKWWSWSAALLLLERFPPWPNNESNRVHWLLSLQTSGWRWDWGCHLSKTRAPSSWSRSSTHPKPPVHCN